MKYILTLALMLVFAFCTAQVETIEINEDYVDRGAEILLKEEDGSRYMQFQPDVSGTGGFISVDDGLGEFGFIAEGNSTSSLATVKISGTSETIFRTWQTGDASIVFPSDAISSVEIANEVGASHETNQGGSVINNIVSTIASTTITVPADGFVLVMAHGQTQMSHVNGTNTIYEFGVGDQNTILAGVQDVAVGLPASAPSGSYYLPGAAHGMFEVAAGTHTFYYLGKSILGSPNMTMVDSRVTAIYIPTNYGTIEAEFNGNNEDERMLPVTAGMTEEQILSSSKASIIANDLRIQKEIDDLKAEISALGINRNHPGQQK